MKPDVMPLFDEATNTVSYVVADPTTRAAALVDSVLDFDPKSGRTATTSADRMIALVRERGLTVEWILETHVHADHLSAAPYLTDRIGGRIGIGEHIREVQKVFRTLFNMEPGFVADGRQFDHLFADGERFRIGQLEAQAIHTPGHTTADMTYVVSDAAFVGDTLFQPDYGTARCDFPGGDAHALYHSIRRILSLPPETRIFTGHDYKAPGRDEYSWESTVAEQRARNVHVRDGVSETEFVELRTARDRTLDVPKLILPSVQVNVRAGRLPPAEENGKRYLKIPIDTL
ncbi:MBL fold metallo-hydrolase [Azospirillum sp. BE72]|uniref:MBL fold metallo-hydrolase n=1 Tax=Azospirillum sp. BE72 TaxID=2817776 RepID=UPI0028614922|nr:MBL fold metallo-hydrolase [Azospirillum sp. BE72]MDR6775153.1 glyoxylase-like metal-dependent hydrolase (beta-lactamase superfamily II) [Azospirillum sp. BE72]